MELLKVARVPAIVAAPDMSVLNAAILMSEDVVRAVVITSREKQVLGIFTEHDNLIRVTCRLLDPKTTLLSEVMTAPVQTAFAETTVEEGLAIMTRHHCRHLPIVDCDRRIVGLVSLRHLLLRRIGEKQADLEVLAAYLTAGGPG